MKLAGSVLIAGAALTVLAGCGGGETPAAPQAQAAAAGERLTLRETAVADLKPAAGTISAHRMGEARARIGGVLTVLSVREGDKVREGQVVGRVADQRIDLTTAAFGAQAAAAAAQAARAEADLGRIRVLYDKGVYAKARLDQAEAEATAARGLLEAARAQRDASAEAAAQGAVLAPAAGTVLRVDVPEGSVVAPGQSVATVTAGDILLRVEIPEGEALDLRPGDVLKVSDDDLPGAGEARVRQVYPAVRAGVVTIDADLPGLPDALVGRRVRVLVPAGARRALVVPRRFVATRFGVDYVRVLGPGGRAGEVPVQTAPTPDPGAVEILSGAAAGDVLLAGG